MNYEKLPSVFSYSSILYLQSFHFVPLARVDITVAPVFVNQHHSQLQTSGEITIFLNYEKLLSVFSYSSILYLQSFHYVPLAREDITVAPELVNQHHNLLQTSAAITIFEL